MSFQCTCDVQSTPDNSNLKGSRKKFELLGARRVTGGTAQ